MGVGAFSLACVRQMLMHRGGNLMKRLAGSRIGKVRNNLTEVVCGTMFSQPGVTRVAVHWVRMRQNLAFKPQVRENGIFILIGHQYAWTLERRSL